MISENNGKKRNLRGYFGELSDELFNIIWQILYELCLRYV